MPSKTVLQQDVPLAPKGTAGLVPTQRELNALLATASYDTSEEAAESIGVTAESIRGQLFSLRHKLGVRTNLQAYHMLARGYLVKVTTTTTVELERRSE